jgi:hypothetical protein
VSESDPERRDIPTRFKPGNRAGRGRRKGSISLTTLIRKSLAGTTLAGEEIPGGRTVAELLVDEMIVQATKGNAGYMREIISRNDGLIPKPTTDERVGAADIIARAAEKARERKRSRKPDEPAG